MTSEQIYSILPSSGKYNLHSHTQFCDGRASIEVLAEAAYKEGMTLWGITPHSPVPVESGANMSRDDVGPYLDAAREATADYDGKMKILTGMEVDFLGHDFGPHIDYFQNMPLDYRIGSVHFVPNQDGYLLDCDGKTERFMQYLRDGYANDLRYVVEKYFEQVLIMIELGGFEILGHFDKIAGNASSVDPKLENYGWYRSLVEDVINHSKDAGILMEINTKSSLDKNRFFPARRWWPLLTEANIPLVINSDAHYADKVDLGRPEALRLLKNSAETVS